MESMSSMDENISSSSSNESESGQCTKIMEKWAKKSKNKSRKTHVRRKKKGLTSFFL